MRHARMRASAWFVRALALALPSARTVNPRHSQNVFLASFLLVSFIPIWKDGMILVATAPEVSLFFLSPRLAWLPPPPAPNAGAAAPSPAVGFIPSMSFTSLGGMPAGSRVLLPTPRQATPGPSALCFLSRFSASSPAWATDRQTARAHVSVSPSLSLLSLCLSLSLSSLSLVVFLSALSLSSFLVPGHLHRN